jgi:glutaredoxin
MIIMARCAIYTSFLEKEASFIFYDEPRRARARHSFYYFAGAHAKQSAMPTKPHVKLYTKPGCHLCDEAKQEMLAAGITDEYTFEEVNIERDGEAYERYKFEIPVITINGIKAFKYRLTREEFRRRVRRSSTL